MRALNPGTALLTAVWSTLLLGLAHYSPAHAQLRSVDELTRLGNFAVVEPEVVETLARKGAPSSRGELLMRIEGLGARFELALEDNVRLVERVGEARRAELSARGDRFLRGTIAGLPDSWVRLNRIGGRYSGAIYDGTDLFLLDDAAGFSLPPGQAVDADATLLMRYQDIELGGLFDHGGAAPGGPIGAASNAYGAFVEDLRGAVPADGLALLSMPVTIVADTSFASRHGSNAEAVAIGRVNFVDGIFANQLGVGILLLHYEELSDNGPLTSNDPDTLLTDQFRTFMRSGDGSDIPFGGLAHLFTGRNLNGSTVGYAYINVLCSRSFGYGINQNLNSNTTSSLVFAHELGHNYSANHVDEGIMRASVGGSDEFSAESVEVMSAALSRANCLVDNIGIFRDDFE